MAFEGEYSALPEQTEVAVSASTTVGNQLNEEEMRFLGLVDCYSELLKGGLRGWSDARRALNMQAVGPVEFQQALLELERGGFISLIFDGDVLTGIVSTSG